MDWSVYFDPQIWLALKGVLVAIGIDFGLSVILALKQGEFKFHRAASVLHTNVLPYMGGLAILGAFAGDPASKAAFFTACAALAAKYMADWRAKFKELFGVDADKQ